MNIAVSQFYGVIRIDVVVEISQVALAALHYVVSSQAAGLEEAQRGNINLYASHRCIMAQLHV